MKYSEQLKQLLAFLRNAKSKLSEDAQAEQRANDETQDILHCLELEENDYYNCARLSMALCDIRHERRKAKDDARLLQPVVEWMERNKKAYRELEQLFEKLYKEEKEMGNRTYRPRTSITKDIFEEPGAVADGREGD